MHAPGSHLRGSPCRGASAWLSRTTAARRPPESGARPWQAGRAPGVDHESEPEPRPRVRASGAACALDASATAQRRPVRVRGRGGASAPGLHPAWSEPGPARAPPRAGRETEAEAGRPGQAPGRGRRRGQWRSSGSRKRSARGRAGPGAEFLGGTARSLLLAPELWVKVQLLEPTEPGSGFFRALEGGCVSVSAVCHEQQGFPATGTEKAQALCRDCSDQHRRGCHAA